MLADSLTYSSSIKTERVLFSETSVKCLITWYHILEDISLLRHRYENLRFRFQSMITLFYMGKICMRSMNKGK